MSDISSKAIITVIGQDTVGIISRISGKCAEYHVNILDITQKVFDSTFAMIMQVDVGTLNVSFADFSDILCKQGDELGVVVRTVHEEIFKTMHHI